MKRRILNDDKAVSPVIATILMVAITVVLAATLYMMLPKSSTDSSDVSMNVSIQTTDEGWRVSIIEGTIDLEGSADDISVFNTATGTRISNITVDRVPESDTDNYGDWPSDTADGVDQVIAWQDTDSDEKLGPEDSILISDGSRWLDGYELRIEGVSFVGSHEFDA